MLEGSFDRFSSYRPVFSWLLSGCSRSHFAIDSLIKESWEAFLSASSRSKESLWSFLVLIPWEWRKGDKFYWQSWAQPVLLGVWYSLPRKEKLETQSCLKKKKKLVVRVTGFLQNWKCPEAGHLRFGYCY